MNKDIGLGFPSPVLTDGIIFPATRIPSDNVNTLDDYEEGTWTPSLGGTATYSVQAGFYTKIGNFVFVRGRLELTAIGTGSTTQISGLPFTATASGGIGGASVGTCSDFEGLATAIVALFPVLASNTITIWSLTAAASIVGGSAIFGSLTKLTFTATYHTTQ